MEKLPLGSQLLVGGRPHYTFHCMLATAARISRTPKQNNLDPVVLGIQFL